MENKKKYFVTYYRVYVNGEEVFASKSLRKIVDNMHYVEGYYNLKENDLQFRVLTYSPSGAVVSNQLITTRISDFFD